MTDNNNFEKVDNYEASDELKDKSLKNTEGNVGAVKAFLNVLDLYISKFFDAFIHSVKDETDARNGFAAGLTMLSADEDGEHQEEDEDKENNDNDDL